MYPTAVLTFFLALLASFPAIQSVAEGDRSAYEILQEYNFPVGLLPKGVLRYDLDKTTGKFSAYLNGSCGFSLEGSYQIKYKPTISGYISKGKLKQLGGVSVKVLFVWLNIVEISRSGDDLEFSVGIASADFPIDNFEECPQCGCGLDCNNLRVSNLRTKPFLSSV